jgi:hypothetical protein
MSRRSQSFCILAVLLGLLGAADASASKTLIAGSVFDRSGATLSGVKILAKQNCVCSSCRHPPPGCWCCPAAVEVVTDANGRFSLSATPGTYTIKASLTGYTTKKITVSVKDGKTASVTIRLKRTKAND